MGYDSKQGLYYSFFINNKEQDFNPSFVTDIKFYHSIFDLFPKATFTSINKENSIYQNGFVNIENEVRAEFGTSEDDDNMDEFKDFIVEKHQITDAKSNLDSTLIVMLTNKNAPLLRNISAGKGWNNKSTEEVIKDVVSSYYPNNEIEKTSTKGNWLKPNNQSNFEFLKILKNRSLPISSAPSKMFMWVDLEGTFHFESLESMLSKKPVSEINLTESETDSITPTDFDYINNGIRYKSEDTNEAYKEYIPTVDGDGALTDIKKPKITKIDGATATGVDDETDKTNQTVLQGFSHSKLPTNYNKAIYINNIYNFPFRFSFTTGNLIVIKPGVLIRLVFPYHSEEELFDTSLSGDYLVTSVRKREVGLQYVNDVYVVSNSEFRPIEPL